MKKLFSKIISVFFLCFICTNMVNGQAIDDTIVEDYFLEFKNEQASEERFNFFFNTPSRYNENSAYDWLDAVNIYLSSSKKTKDSLGITYYKLIQSQIQHDLGDYDRSLSIAKELYSEKEELGIKSKTILLDLMDQNYSQLQLYKDQIDIRIEKRELGITKNVSFYDIYANLGLYRKALNDYILEEEKKSISANDYYSQAIFYNKTATYLRLDKAFPTALKRYKKADGFIKIFLNDASKIKSKKDITNSNLLRAVVAGNIGQCYLGLKKYENAIPYLEKSITTIKEYNTGKLSSELVEKKLAVIECHLQLNNLDKALDYLTDNLYPVKTTNILKKSRLFASFYGKTGDYKNESIYLRRNINVRDSLLTNESEIRKQQTGLVMAADIAYNKSRIEEQREQLEISKNEMVAKDDKINLVFILLIIALLGLSGLVYAYYRSIKNQRLIAEQKHIIETALVEKDSLLKEIHHRVKNNLQMVSSLLSLQTKNTRSKAVIEALEEGKSRVKAMALIHQKLYQNDDLSVIEMQGYIESLINSVQSVYKKGGHNINITIDAEGVELDIDRAIPFGLILNELVSNSFKYAFPKNDDDGKIYIHLRKMGEQEGFFEYTDNGIGMPEDTDEKTSSSMGIRLMKRLVNQLQSTLNIDKTSEGVRFWFNFK